jgi:hypothetical protein
MYYITDGTMHPTVSRSMVCRVYVAVQQLLSVPTSTTDTTRPQTCSSSRRLRPTLRSGTTMAHEVVAVVAVTPQRHTTTSDALM